MLSRENARLRDAIAMAFTPKPKPKPKSESLIKQIGWFTRRSWFFMDGRNHLCRFLLGYPRALFRFLRSA